MSPTVQIQSRAEALIETIRSYGSCAVAFSGGVDSSVVAKAAALAIGDRAVAVTAVSASLAEGELALAKKTAEQIGIRHHPLPTNELANPSYVRNSSDRCFHCKDELYSQIERIQSELQVNVVCNGTNVDDLGDHRPGLTAASQHAVRSPLVECEINKQLVREIAKLWSLDVWDKPAAPCLSSRIAYGCEVTPERLRMIDRAESFLRGLGFTPLRVRLHEGELARIEVATEAIPRLVQEDMQREVTNTFREIGFKSITIDLEGFRSGNLNQLISIEPPQHGRTKD